MKKTISLLLSVVMIITSLLVLPASAQAAQTRNGPSKAWLIENREALKDYLLDWGTKLSTGSYYLGYYTGVQIYDSAFWATLTDSTEEYFGYGLEYFPSTDIIQIHYTYKKLYAYNYYDGSPCDRRYTENTTTLDLPVKSIKKLNYKRTELKKDYVSSGVSKDGEVFIDLVKTAKIDPTTYTRTSEIEVNENGFWLSYKYKNEKSKETSLLDTEMVKWKSMLEEINYKTPSNTTIVGMGFSKYCTSHYDSAVTKYPTCTSEGYTRHTCKYCNTYYDDNIVSATGHTTTTVKTKATYAKEGKSVKKCIDCGKTFSTKSIAKLAVPNITLNSVKSKKSKQITVAWKKNKKVTGYEVQYATNSKFTKNKKTVKISKNSTTSKTISKLKSKTKYYVRVRGYVVENGKNYYSSWSSVKSVKTKK